MKVSVQKVEFSAPTDHKRMQGVLVTRNPLVETHLTHLEMGKLLGLPCSSNQPWKDPRYTNTYVEIDIVSRGDCYTAKEASRDRVGITTFFCKKREEAEKWFQEFKQKTASFNRRHLAPNHLTFCFRLHTFLV